MRLIWNGAPLDEFAPVPRERALARPPRAGPRRRRPRRRHDRPPQRPEGPPLPPRRRGTRAPRGARRRVLSPATATSWASCGEQAAALGIAEPRRLRRAPDRRARPARRARRLLHLVALRGHAARPLRGDGRGQGHRLDRGRRLPRGARGRRHRPCSCRPPTPPLSPRASSASSGTRRSATSLGRQALAASRRYDVRACVDAMQAFYDELLAGGRALSVPLRRLGRIAREAWEVPRDLLLRPLSPVRHRRRAPPRRRPRLRLPRRRARDLRAPPRPPRRERLRHAVGGRVRRRPPGRSGSPRDRAVVLTFDDGRGSVWSVAAPAAAAARHEGRRLPRARPRSPPARDRSRRPGTTSRRAGPTAAAVLRREDGEGALLSWEEVEALARTGLFDFQSHTLRHARVHTRPQLAGFVTPRSRRGYDAFDQPLLREGDRDLLGEEAPLGAPLLRSAPRTSEAPALLRGPGGRGPRASPRSPSQGGEGFFAALRLGGRACGALFGRTRVAGRLETAEERAERHPRASSPSPGG